MSRLSRALAATTIAAAAAGGALLTTATSTVPAYASAPAAGGSAAAGCSAWNGAQPVNPGSASSLDSLALVTQCDVWAVGTTTNSDGSGTHSQPLIEHWTGGSWAAAPGTGTGPGFLNDASAISASDI
jgi:hypothetical protein